MKSNQCATCGGPARGNLCRSCYVSQYDTPTRVCNVCQVEKELSEFGIRPGGPGRKGHRPRGQCKSCESEGTKAWKKKNPEALARHVQTKRAWDARQKSLRESDEEEARLYAEQTIRRSAQTLGLDPDEVLAAFKENGNICQACGRSGRTGRFYRVAIDHCHTTGAFRGFLCGPCNLMLGHMEANLGMAEGLLNYVKEKA